MIREALFSIIDEKRNLTEDEAYTVMDSIMRAGNEETENIVTPAQFGAFLIALRLKGETVDEIDGMARSMREHALHVDVNTLPLLDTCGTGGSSKKVFNASTAAAFIASAAGAKVAKHGNRAMSSRSGSADLLEEMGAVISLSPDSVGQCIEQVGIGFLFAQAFHPSMKFAGPLRPQIGVRTIFNILGPLANPARANCHVMGAPSKELASKLANSLARLGVRHALVVSGEDGLDDLTITGPSNIYEVKSGEVTERIVTPEEMGLSRYPIEDIIGGDPSDNAQIFRDILAGKGSDAIRDLILFNAAAGLYVIGLAASIKDGINKAAKVIESGEAAAKVAAFIEMTRRLEA
ncbi:MAG: anthranilate phosphoribosyltransferase [Dehalococcoidia bacterium]|nr:anthranilate phosphoribosyltransferase [Dehalococcoidia bacterium]